MTETSRTIQFPRLVDSSVETGISTLNSDMVNNKQKVIKISMEVTEWDYNKNTGENKHMKFYCEPEVASNLNYKIKSALNQIEEVIKYISQK
jgi:hypothetical protein